MVKFWYRCVGLWLVFSLSLYILFHKTSEKDCIPPVSLKNIPKPKSENWSRFISVEEKGFPFLSDDSILKDYKGIVARNMSFGSNSKLIFTDKRPYYLGEEIKVTIILYNACGERMLRGGDHLMLWMENLKVKASVSGKVMDNDDGTYSGTVKAMWSGEAVIGVRILVRREVIALIYQMYKTYHSLSYNYAEFRNGEMVEESECSVAPYNNSLKWCNLTSDNACFPWFCIKPKQSGLTCSMWTSTWSGMALRPIASLEVLWKLWRQSNERDLLPKTSVTVRGTDGKIPSPYKPCNRIEPEVTWNRKSPKGLFYRDKWHSMQCTDTMTHTPNAYRECLNGRTLYLHGDSTSLQFIIYLTYMLNLELKGNGHNPVIVMDTDFNFTLSWYAHELPFYHGGVHHHKSVNLAQHIVLDKIPSNSRDIIILYLYVHFTINHPDVFKQHVKRLVQSVRKLILRAPGVTIAVRGPHAFMKMGGSKLLISYWGLHYTDILYEEFASLRKNVLFLDYWDMTMANIPTNVHPPTETVINMVHYMMSIICNRN